MLIVCSGPRSVSLFIMFLSLDIVESLPKAKAFFASFGKIMQELLKRHGVNKNGQILIHILTVKQNESCCFFLTPNMLLGDWVVMYEQL